MDIHFIFSSFSCVQMAAGHDWVDEEEVTWVDEYDDQGCWEEGDDFVVGRSNSNNSQGRRRKKRQQQSQSGDAQLKKGEDLGLVVAKWYQASRLLQVVDPHSCQHVMILVLAHLKQRYAAQFPSRSSPSTTNSSTKGMAHVSLDKVDLVFSDRGKEVQCQPGTGQIEFGLETTKKELYDGARSRYALENNYMNQVKNAANDPSFPFLSGLKYVACV